MYAAGSRHGAEDMEGVSQDELLLSRVLLHVLHVNVIPFSLALAGAWCMGGEREVLLTMTEANSKSAAGGLSAGEGPLKLNRQTVILGDR